MGRIPNVFGGGAQTNINGLQFEQTTSLDEALEEAGYIVEKCLIFKEKNLKIHL